MAMFLSATPATGLGDELSADEKAGIDAAERGDLIAAIEYFEQAANDGSALAQTRLAWIMDGANLDERAVELYRAAAEQDYAPGMHGLAEMYAKGEGVEQSFEQALAWYERAAEQGFDRSIMFLANAYDTGDLGLTPDPKAAAYYRVRLEEVRASAKAEVSEE